MRRENREKLAQKIRRREIYYPVPPPSDCVRGNTIEGCFLKTAPNQEISVLYANILTHVLEKLVGLFKDFLL